MEDSVEQFLKDPEVVSMLKQNKFEEVGSLAISMGNVNKDQRLREVGASIYRKSPRFQQDGN